MNAYINMQKCAVETLIQHVWPTFDCGIADERDIGLKGGWVVEGRSSACISRNTIELCESKDVKTETKFACVRHVRCE